MDQRHRLVGQAVYSVREWATTLIATRCRMSLTVKQNECVIEIAGGASQTSAYRSAYNTQNMSQKTVWEEASRLRRHPKVAARIMELEAEEKARRRM